MTTLPNMPPRRHPRRAVPCGPKSCPGPVQVGDPPRPVPGTWRSALGPAMASLCLIEHAVSRPAPGPAGPGTGRGGRPPADPGADGEQRYVPLAYAGGHARTPHGSRWPAAAFRNASNALARPAATTEPGFKWPAIRLREADRTGAMQMQRGAAARGHAGLMPGWHSAHHDADQRGRFVAPYAVRARGGRAGATRRPRKRCRMKCQMSGYGRPRCPVPTDARPASGFTPPRPGR